MMRLVKRQQVDDDYATQVKYIATQLNLPELLVGLLFGRGVKTLQSIREFVDIDNKSFCDPMLMLNMDKLCDRINLAKINNHKILLHGDYDCDGLCSTAILYRYLTTIGCTVVPHIPDRYGYGYGIKIDSIRELVHTHNIDLVLTCDCGISNCMEIDWLNSQGIDTIVTDHHTPGQVIPNCIVVNPNIEGCNYPFKQLCGAGIALKVVQALGADPMQYMDLACIATIGDIVPLLDENRLIVRHGLQLLNSNNIPNKGLKQLVDDLHLSSISANDISFKLVPKINAVGRMESPIKVLQLLTTQDNDIISQLVQDINAYNDTRKQLCTMQYKQAIAQLSNQDATRPYILLISDEWKKGLTGILAAQLSNDFGRPTFVLAHDKDGIYRATARSIHGINLYSLLTESRDLLIEYGGHSAAAGFSIHRDKISQFEYSIHTQLVSMDKDLYQPRLEYDLDIEWGDITIDFVQSLQLLQPFGMGNPQPLFRLTATTMQYQPLKTLHTRVDTNGVKLIKFNDCNSTIYKDPSPKELILQLDINEFGNTKTVEGYIKHIQSKDLYIDNDVCNAVNVLNQCLCNHNQPNYSDIDIFGIKRLMDNDFGTLVICSNRHNYLVIKGLSPNKFNHNSFLYCEVNNATKIVVAPILSSVNLGLYKDIVFDSMPYNMDMISHINAQTASQVHVCNLHNPLPKLDFGHDMFGKVYKAIVSIAKDTATLSPTKAQPMSRDLVHLSELIQSKYNIDMPQAILCYKVFEELGIVKTTSCTPLLYSIVNTKTSLEQSSIYRQMQ
ncbi:MAG: single-stranded-DNA-specific exonuclease RecJ [Clostridiales bacterium]|jgi:single-stranded-DNA-specific exonuclease|nr:single-stranded-DNA-specific exonuclease RecJ [Clostridiales bacterium]